MTYVRPVYNLYEYLKGKDELTIFVVDVTTIRLQPRKWKYKNVLIRTPNCCFYTYKKTKVGVFLYKYMEKLKKRKFEMTIEKTVTQYKAQFYVIKHLRFKE